MPDDFSLHFGLVTDNSSVVHSRHVSAFGQCNTLMSWHVAQGTVKLSCDLFKVKNRIVCVNTQSIECDRTSSVVVLHQILCNVLGCLLMGGGGGYQKINKYTYVQTM